MFEILPRHFVEKPWGRTDLPPIFGSGERRIGEVWFDRAEVALPVLVKWLFTSERLSIQVHPNDMQAAERGMPSGKEECWIVTDVDADARLGIGLTQDLSDSELREASLSGEIEKILDWKQVRPGDWFFIPAGTIHAIGAGIRLVEIQQNADITYRLYDYGRPRELHLDDGVAVSQPGAYAGHHGVLPTQQGLSVFMQTPHFTISCIRGDKTECLNDLAEQLFIPVSGAFSLDGTLLLPGQVGIGNIAEIRGHSTDSFLLCSTLK